MAMRDVMQLKLYVPCFHVRALRPSNIFPTVGVMENLLEHLFPNPFVRVEIIQSDSDIKD